MQALADGRAVSLSISPLGGQLEDVTLIDYDELDSLLDGLEDVGKVDWSVTSLPGFDAVYTTKGGFRAAAIGSRRTGNIEFGVRSIRAARPLLLLSRDQFGSVAKPDRAEQGQTRFAPQRKIVHGSRFTAST